MEKNPEIQLVQPRKRPKLQQSWKRSLEKCERYKSPGVPIKQVKCVHRTKQNTYLCDKLKSTDISYFHRLFYTHETKMDQDRFIIKFTEAMKTQRSRVVNGKRGPNTFSYKYFVITSNNIKIQVCRKAFIDVLLITKSRVEGVLKRFVETKKMPEETRGGNRKVSLFHDRKASVINFIKKLKCVESHYCRSKTATRVYLSSDLNINKLWRFYDRETNDQSLKVKPTFFRNVFNRNFNIGFGSPSTDECSTCLSLTEQIKRCDSDLKKIHLKTDLNVHKLKAKSFYNMLKSKNRNYFSFSFDCQKNLILPRVPDQSAYYSRQLYMYNLTVVSGDSKMRQNKENVYIYNWTENQHKKSSNEIASAIYDFLLNFTSLTEEKTRVRAFCDGCGGQNKNSTFIGMMAYWLLKIAPETVKKVEIVFPMVGHSFLPPDRVFGRIEKEIKAKNVVVEPSQYVNIFKNQGTPISLAGKVANWKSALSKILRPPGQWHFKFQPCKRFILTRSSTKTNILVRGEKNYLTDIGHAKSVCKKGKNFSENLPFCEIPIGVDVSEQKLDDVGALLKKHFGEDWRALDTLDFYKEVIDRTTLPIQNDIKHVTNMDVCQFPDMNENLYI
nr:uncharacterized protein LOC112211192 [Halyomorpha halys]